MEAFENFTAKAGNYAKFRPSYAEACLNYLANEAGFAGKEVADIGCGTGIFSRLLASFAKTVYAVEPNADMRSACQQQCRTFVNIHVSDGTAEHSQLPEQSVDFVTVAQAFHWFDAAKFRNECRRILHPQGRVVLVWNQLDWNGAILGGIRRLCADLGIEYIGFNSSVLNHDTLFKEFFASGEFMRKAFDNPLSFDREQFVGRYLSSSYSPKADDPRYPAYVQGLRDLFEQHRQGDNVTMPYQTLSFLGAV
jgi:SAM-dependent methyltransferase